MRAARCLTFPRRPVGGAVVTFHSADLHLARRRGRRQLVGGRERRAAHPVFAGRRQGAVAQALDIVKPHDFGTSDRKSRARGGAQLRSERTTAACGRRRLLRAPLLLAKRRRCSRETRSRSSRNSRAIIMPFNYGWVVLFDERSGRYERRFAHGDCVNALAPRSTDLTVSTWAQTPSTDSTASTHPAPC